MFLGHFAVALAAKRAAPQVSLGTLVLSAQFLDLLWPLFLLLGVEHVRINPGDTAVTPLDFYDYPLSHSLLTALGWAVVVGGTYFLVRREARGSLVLYGAVLSHWILDAITHRPDLPLIPGFDVFVGLGLWNSLAGTVIVELALFVAAVILYVKDTGAVNRTGVFSLWLFVILLGAIYFLNIFGPPPPSESMIGVVGLSAWLFVLWGYAIDRQRRART